MKKLLKDAASIRLVSVFLLVMMFVSMMCMSASAAETGDTEINGFKATVVGYHAMDNGDARPKTNSTSMYLYLTGGTYSTVRVRALGSTNKVTWHNRTYYYTDLDYVTCSVGTKYMVHNYINESGESYAKYSFHSTYSNPNYITGKWSPDCTEQSSYTHAVP